MPEEFALPECHNFIIGYIILVCWIRMSYIQNELFLGLLSLSCWRGEGETGSCFYIGSILLEAISFQDAHKKPSLGCEDRHRWHFGPFSSAVATGLICQLGQVSKGGWTGEEEKRSGWGSGSTLFLTGHSIHVRTQTHARAFCSANRFGRGKHLGGPRSRGYTVWLAQRFWSLKYKLVKSCFSHLFFSFFFFL